MVTQRAGRSIHYPPGADVRAVGLVAGISLCLSCAACSPTNPTGATTPPPPTSAPTAEAELFVPNMKSCLETAGYVVDVLDDGGISVKWAPENSTVQQRQELKKAYDAAYAACLKEFGYDKPPKSDPANSWRQSLAIDDCLRAHGYPVKSPTLEEFTKGGESDWSSVPKDMATIQQLSKECGF